MSLEGWEFDDVGDGLFPIGDFTYREMHDSGTASFTNDSSSAQRVFLVDWDEHEIFVDYLLGFSTRVGTQFDLHREVPDVHPLYFYWYCTEASVVPMGGKTSVNTTDGMYAGQGVSAWPLAKVTATYHPLKWLVRDDDDPLLITELDRYVERVPLQVKADFVTVNSQFRFVSSTATPKATLTSSPGIIQPSISVRYTHRQIPAVLPDIVHPNSEMIPPNVAFVQQLLGKCNSRPFDGYRPGTVLFVDYEANLVLPKLKDGLFYWDLSYIFEIRDNGDGLPGPGLPPQPLEAAGVNYIFSTITRKYDLVTHDGTIGGERIYRSGDLNLLFA